MNFLKRFTPRDHAAHGTLCMIYSTVLLAVMWALSKRLTADYPVAEVAFFRFFFGIIPLLPLWHQAGLRRSFGTKRFISHVYRGGAGLISLTFNFLALKHLPLATGITLTFTSPIFIVILACIFLKDRVDWHRWAAILIGFVGVLFIAKPASLNFDIGIIYGLTGALMMSVAMILLRGLGKTETTLTCLTYFTVLSCCEIFPFAYMNWVPPSPGDWVLFAITGFFGGAGQWFVVRAYQLAKPAVVAPYNYLSIVWSAIIQTLFWGAWPAQRIWIGIALIIGSGIFIRVSEKRAAAIAVMK